MNFQNVELGQLRLSGLEVREMINALRHIPKDKVYWIYTLNLENAWNLIFASNRKELLAAIDVYTLDGWPLVCFRNFLRPSGTPKQTERCTGSDLFGLCLNSDDFKKIAVIGGWDHERLFKVRKEKFSADSFLSVSGRIENASELNEIEKKLIEYNPDIIFLALNTEKAIVLAQHLKSKLKSGIVIGVGSAVDHITGHQKKAPLFFSKNKLEWLYRFVHSPRRLWFRYLVKSPMSYAALLLMSLRQKLR